MRLRNLLRINPSKSEVAHLPAATEVTFAPMEAIADGLGGLDVSLSKEIDEVRGGSYNYFADGDILLAKVTPCFENGKKAFAQGLKNGIGFATSEVHVVRPANGRIDPVFLTYVLSSEDFRAAAMATMTGAGGLRRISEGAVLDYRVSIAELPTQKAIAAFLDRETSRIDQLIAKKERMARLLADRQSLTISGIFKRLEVEGCPQRRLRHLLSAPLKYGINESADDDPTGIRFIRITDLTADGNLRSDTIRSLPREKTKGCLLIDGDILFARSGATVGKSFIYESDYGPCCFAGYLIRARVNRKLVNPEYVKLYTQSNQYREFIALSFIQATIPNVSAERYAQLLLPVPSTGEQTALVNRAQTLSSVTQKTQKGIGLSVTRLRELRSALITAAVAGQIDVAIWGRRGETDRRLDEIAHDLEAARSEAVG